MKKRIVSIILGLILVVGLLAACGSGGGDETPPAGSGSSAGGEGGLTGTLTIAMLATNEPGMVKVIEDFEAAYPGTHIEAEFISDIAAYSTNIPARFTADTSTDIVHLIAGKSSATSVGAVGATGKILDLSNEPWVGDMYEGAKELFEVDGKVYAMDFGFCPLACLFVNNTIFKENGVEIPKTFDELLAACDKFNAAGITPISFAGGEVFVNMNSLDVMLGNEVLSKNGDWWSQMLAGETTFAGTPDAVKTVDMFKQLIDRNAFGPGAAAMTQVEMISSFASGEAAMMFAYGGQAGTVFAQDPDLDISEVPFPASEAGNSRIMVQAAGGLAIAGTCKNVELAKAFLEFFRRPEEMSKYAEAAAVISVTQIKEGKTEGLYENMTGTPFIADISARYPNTTMGQKMGSALQGLFTGQTDVNGCAAAFDEFFNAE